MPSPASDDESKLSFVIGPLRNLRQDDRRAGSNHDVRKFIEDGGDFGDFHLSFSSVVPIVEPDTDELRRAGNWREKGDIAEIVGGSG